MMEHRGTNRRTMVGMAIAAGAGARIFSNGTSSNASAQATPPTVTERVPAPAWFVTLHQLQDPYAGVIQAPAEPPAGTRYVAAELQIDNEADQALAFTPADVRLRDESGFEYRGGTAVGQEPMLNARNLNGGERSRGWVWFTVAAEARVTSLVYIAPAPQFRIAVE